MSNTLITKRTSTLISPIQLITKFLSAYKFSFLCRNLTSYTQLQFSRTVKSSLVELYMLFKQNLSFRVIFFKPATF